MYLFNVLFFISSSFYALVNCQEHENNNCPQTSTPLFAAQVYLFYAPNHTESIRERIVAYYFNPDLQPNDALVIATIHPITGHELPVYRYPETKSGIIYTTIKPVGDSVSYTQKCIGSGYFAYWLRNDTKSKTVCLQNHPDWMNQRRHLLRERSLTSIIIPGTHHSGSYIETPQTILDHVSVTQDTSVLKQLISGARYLDFRPSARQSDGDYWIVHGVRFMQPLSSILAQIKDFLDNVESEVIIISFRQFPYVFAKSIRHTQFIDYLKQELNGYILNRPRNTWNITFGEIWQSNRRLIISYNNPIYKETVSLWPGITQQWGNVQSIEGLREYLASVEFLSPFPRVSMAELTMDYASGVAHFTAGMAGLPHESLINMAAVIGPNITKWYNEIFFPRASIIAVDYIDATGIVEVAIEWNDRRMSPCYQNYRHAMSMIC